MSATSANKYIVEPNINDSGWGTTLNSDFSIIDSAFGGNSVLGSTSGTLSAAQIQSLSLTVPSGITAITTYTLPLQTSPSTLTVGGQWIVSNPSAYSVIFQDNAAASNVTISAGSVRSIYCDGTSVRFSDTQSVPSSSGQVIYNSSGSLTGSSNLTFDGSTLAVDNAVSLGSSLTTTVSSFSGTGSVATLTLASVSGITLGGYITVTGFTGGNVALNGNYAVTNITGNNVSYANGLSASTTSITGPVVTIGNIKALSGGVTFPDGTKQTTAAVASAYPAGVIPSAFSGLKITANNLSVTISSNYVSLFNGTTFYTAAAPSITISANTIGANGLDTGSLATNWYSVWIIYNPTTTTVAGLLSLSATAPTLPSGYTFQARVGWVRAASGSALVATYQYGNSASYKSPVNLSSSGGAISTATSAPTTAGFVSGTIYQSGGSSNVALYAPDGSTTITSVNSGNTAIFSSYAQFNVAIPTQIISWSIPGGSGTLYVDGWTDNL